jgi:AraC-like DNA-binding protein
MSLMRLMVLEPVHGLRSDNSAELKEYRKHWNQLDCRVKLRATMLQKNERRRIDWRVTMADDPPQISVVPPSKQAFELAEWTSAILSDPSPDTIDRFLRYAVEFARDVIRLERTGLFVFDAHERAMIGTWGSDARGLTVDEHDIMYDYGDVDREVFARAEQGHAWTVFEDFPLIAQSDNQTRILCRGWVCCSAIVGARGPIGILFNDTALTRSALDESKQARAAVLCSLLGRALDPCRKKLLQSGSYHKRPQHPLVAEVSGLLAQNPSLGCESLAKQLKVSIYQLARLFRRYAGTSIVDYRNDLRLARFLGQIDPRADNMRKAVSEAGFGSYAQFLRVFRARFGQTPSEYLSASAE